MSTEPVLGSGGEQQHLDEVAEHAAHSARKPGRIAELLSWWQRQPRAAQWAILLPVLLFIFFLPVINPPILTTEPGNDWPIACFDMARFALVALGLNVVVGQAGLLDLGYVGFFAVGSYVAALWTSPDSTFVHIPYLWTLPLAMVVTVFFGVCLGVPTLRLRGDYLAIVTLGFGEIIRLLGTLIPALRGQVGFKEVGQPPGPEQNGVPLFANSHGTPWYMLTVVIIVVVMVLLGNIERSRVGRAWIAIREDEDAAEIMGVPTFKFKIWAFATGAAIGGLSGALFAGQVGFVNNAKFDVVTSVLFLAAVILGGAGNRFGVILGGAIVSYIPNRFTAIADYKYLIFGVALVLLMIFRSQGLVGARAHLLAYARRARLRTAEVVAARRASAEHEEAAS